MPQKQEQKKKFGIIYQFKQEIIKAIAAIEENYSTNWQIGLQNQKQLKNLFKKKEAFIEEYTKEKDILKNAIQDEKITKENYNKIRKICEIMNFQNNLPIRNEEIIEADLDLKLEFQRIKIQMRKANKKTIKKYSLDKKIYINIDNIRNTMKKITAILEEASTNDMKMEQLEEKLMSTVEKIVNTAEEESKLYVISEKTLLYGVKQEEIGKIDRKKFNTRIINTLLKNSNYNLIFNYIYIVQKCKEFDLIKYSVQKVKLAPKEKNKGIILKITNEFLENEKFNEAFYFLKYIEVKRYLNYLPNDRTASEYLAIIDKHCGMIPKLHVQREIFFEDNYEKYEDTILCLKAWIQYVENSEDARPYKILKQIDAITDILLEDINILEKDGEILKKIEEISDNSIKMKGISTVKTIRLINKILTSEMSVNEKGEYLRKVEGINGFRYLENEFDLTTDMIKLKNYFYSVTLESKIIFKKLLENITCKDIQDIIYIYMNTNVKYIYYIEDFVRDLLKIGDEHIFENLNQYRFYGHIWKTKKKDYCRIKLLNVRNSRSRILRKEVNQEKSWEDSIFEVDIKEYDKFNEQLNFKNFRVCNTIQEENNNQENKEESRTNRLEIIEKQIDFIGNYNQNQIWNIIRNIDNPYQYINEAKNGEKIDKRTLAVQEREKEFVKGIREKYYERVTKQYSNLLNDESLSIKNLINYYMNTVMRYIFSLEELCEMIAKTEKYKGKRIFGIPTYSIIFKDIDENNNIIGLQQLDCNKIKYYENSSRIKIDFTNHLTYLIGTSITYDVEKKEVWVTQINYSNIKRNSNEYLKVIKILEEFVKTSDMEVLKELENIPTMAELLNINNMKFAWKKYLFKEYKLLYYQCISNLINDFDKLKKFLEYLGKNNYWRKQNDETRYWESWTINETFVLKKVEEIFLQKAKKEKVENIFFCYQNTYLVKTVTLNQLLRIVFRFNPNGKEKVHGNGRVDMSSYQIEIVKKIESKNKVYGGNNTEGMNVQIVPYNNALIGQKKYLKILEYDTVNNSILLEPLEKETEKGLLTRTTVYLQLCEKLFDIKYRVKDIYNFLTDLETQKENMYDKEKISPKFIKTYIQDNSLELQEKIIKKFKAYIKNGIDNGMIDEKNINDVFVSYDKTIMRYLIPLNEFLNLLKSDGIACDFNFEIDFIYNKDSLENKCLVYFPRYYLISNAKIQNENNLQLELREEYTAIIKNYDKSEDMIILEVKGKKVHDENLDSTPEDEQEENE